jgi:hypothetical protein
VTPSVFWGLSVGLVIAAIDTVSIVLLSTAWASQWPITDIDTLANVVLYALIGFRVGKVTGVVRDAAEAGVMAGVLVAAIGIAATAILRPPTDTLDSTTAIVGVVAQNIAMGGVLAIVAGWLGTRATDDRPSIRR